MKFSKIEDEQRKYNKYLHSVLIKHEIINNLEGNTFSQEQMIERVEQVQSCISK